MTRGSGRGFAVGLDVVGAARARRRWFRARAPARPSGARSSPIHHHLGGGQMAARVGKIRNWGFEAWMFLPLGRHTRVADSITARPGNHVFAIEGPQCRLSISMSGRRSARGRSAGSRTTCRAQRIHAPQSPEDRQELKPGAGGAHKPKALPAGPKNPTKATLENRPGHRCPVNPRAAHEPTRAAGP